MQRCKPPQIQISRSRLDSIHETEHRLTSLRLLICDLLKTNQELREALQQAAASKSDDVQPESPCSH